MGQHWVGMSLKTQQLFYNDQSFKLPQASGKKFFAPVLFYDRFFGFYGLISIEDRTVNGHLNISTKYHTESYKSDI